MEEEIGLHLFGLEEKFQRQRTNRTAELRNKEIPMEVNIDAAEAVPESARNFQEEQARRPYSRLDIRPQPQTWSHDAQSTVLN